MTGGTIHLSSLRSSAFSSCGSMWTSSWTALCCFSSAASGVLEAVCSILRSIVSGSDLVKIVEAARPRVLTKEY
jgi:hypothetical protein